MRETQGFSLAAHPLAQVLNKNLLSEKMDSLLRSPAVVFICAWST